MMKESYDHEHFLKISIVVVSQLMNIIDFFSFIAIFIVRSEFQPKLESSYISVVVRSSEIS